MLRAQSAVGLWCFAWLFLLVMAGNAVAHDLLFAMGDEKRRWTSGELLAHPSAKEIEVKGDPAYKQVRRYRAVPLLELLPNIAAAGFDTLEARATDGFVSQIPWAVIWAGGAGGSVPWVAVEDPAKPWPVLPGRTTSAGPFYLVWEKPGLSNVGNEQWPYALASMRAVASPEARWPQLAIAEGSERQELLARGLAVYIKQCLACHKMNGAGEGDMGPDLGRPMNPVDYMTPLGLRRLIRDPASVRTWPAQQMPGFSEEMLPEADLDALIAYMHHQTRR